MPKWPISAPRKKFFRLLHECELLLNTPNALVPSIARSQEVSYLVYWSLKSWMVSHALWAVAPLVRRTDLLENLHRSAALAAEKGRSLTGTLSVRLRCAWYG